LVFADSGKAATITEFPVASSNPAGITAGPDGALWFTEEAANRIGRITTAGSVTHFTIPTSTSEPAEITPGPDGRLWFTEFATNKVGAITTSGTIQEFSVPGSGSNPDGITAGPDGALWFAEAGSNQIGRITTAGVVTNEYTLPSGSEPGDIDAGPDGRLWFTEALASKIGAITTTGTITHYTLTSGSDPSGITTFGSELWFSEFGRNRIGKITTTGTITEFIVPTAASGPSGIVPGADGALWFTEANANKIGRITTAGAVTNEFPVPTSASEPDGIAAGLDGALWFTEKTGNKIGRLQPDTGYPRPKGATPLRASLVPAYQLCAAGNRTHGAPLSNSSCAPPLQASGQLTVGTPDSNGQGANAIGAITLVALPGNTATMADEADLRISVSATDVRRKSNLSDYPGQVQAVLSVRLTDRQATQFGEEPQTTQDFAFRANVSCSGTADTAIGSTCSIVTTADTILPGAVAESKRSIWALDKVDLYDAGPDGNVSTIGDNTRFETQGVFAP
jgi:virginiamycin B lyase